MRVGDLALSAISGEVVMIVDRNIVLLDSSGPMTFDFEIWTPDGNYLYVDSDDLEKINHAN